MWLLLVLGCAPEVTHPPCSQVGDADAALAPSDVDFGEFVDGDALYYGTPPQGGAPYSPFHTRVEGLADLDDGAHVRLLATDLDDGATLGDISYDVTFVCANVGDSAGTWVGSDLHLRFEGWALADLAGRDTEVSVTVESLDGASVEAGIRGQLTEM